MMWSAQAVFTERRVGVAAVVAAATERGMALMGLRSRPGWNGMLVDEIVFATPGGWTAERMEQLLLTHGAASVRISPVVADGDSPAVTAERTARAAHPAGAGRSWLAHPLAS